MSLSWIEELDRLTERAVLEVERSLREARAKADAKPSLWRRLFASKPRGRRGDAKKDA